jgi:hypothetical protein
LNIEQCKTIQGSHWHKKKREMIGMRIFVKYVVSEK